MAKQIGLFFGSFNPVHSGHLIIANFMADYAHLEEIWFVVSPQNPFKASDELLDENERLALLEIAIKDDPRFKTCNIEFNLPRPSYTEHTLAELRKQYPENQFTLIIGGDNLKGFHHWKNYLAILEHHQVFVYARVGIIEKPLLANHPKIKLFEVPLLNISSTYVRESIQAGKSIRYLVPDGVRQAIASKGFYK